MSKDLKKIQLEILEAIESAPKPLEWIPMATVDDNGKVMIPEVVMRYLETQGERVDKGRMDAEVYGELLTKYGLNINRVVFVCYSDDPKDEFIESVLSNEQLKMIRHG